MLQVHFTAQDLMRVGFASQPAPLMELGLAAAALQRRDCQGSSVGGPRTDDVASRQRPSRSFASSRPTARDRCFSTPSATPSRRGWIGSGPPLAKWSSGSVALLGPTRAAVLQLLSRQRTTSEIAADLEISLASASQHTKTLRAAGLVLSEREGKSVWHIVTPLGARLREQTEPTTWSPPCDGNEGPTPRASSAASRTSPPAVAAGAS